VTEEITGRSGGMAVARGERRELPLKQEELKINGWAMEARLYAENPATGFLPSIGRLDHLAFPEELRIDTGVEQGGEVSPFYDPMIAKLIGEVDTLVTPPEPENEELAEAAALLCASPADGPFSAAIGFRLNTALRAEARILDDSGTTHTVAFDEVETEVSTADVLAFADGFARRYVLAEPRGTGLGAVSDGTIFSPMPGRIIAVEVTQGQSVTKGQKLLTLEAMKMEHSLTAPFDGVVAELNAEAGAQVQVEALLVRIEKKED
jgi:3-methylcrotonyl-CoA carboxylase alpha subunit